jgi:hypothetical protein
MNDFFDNPSNVTITFSEIESTQLGGCFVVMGVGFELG